MFLLLVATTFAYSSGKTGNSTSGCGACHGSSASSATSATFSTADTTVEPGETINVSLVVGHATLGGAGLNVSATGGTLAAGSNTRASAGEITQSSTQVMSGGSVTFNFTWTAPAAEGTYTLRGAGNAVDRDRSGDSDDKWNLASSLSLVVDDGCEDLDGDGFESCDDGSGDDCDDTDATVRPGGSETCDLEDDDCDGTIDESPSSGGTSYWLDADGDGYGAGSAVVSCSALSGYVTNASDCNDASAAISPADTEVCNGVDDDCDGTSDESSAADAATWYRDADADGYGAAATTSRSCTLPSGFVANDDDCDDARSGTNPAAAETCDALDLDEDCDGAADDADTGATGRSTWYLDADADGFGTTSTTLTQCSAPAGYSALPGDCLDVDAAFNPSAAESCDDPTDYNCDGVTGYADGDGDGYAACNDCDDADEGAFPGATESCNTVDDDCDGTVDEDDAVDALTWYLDDDGDGFGDAALPTVACTLPVGYADDALDCDDTDADVRPDAPESWYDGVDQDCDGADDDQDGDGVLLADDCDDTDPAAYPGATETWYDGLDADCSGGSDYDADGDGQESASYGGWDCDDADAATYLGAPDAPYDGLVTDCDASDEYDADDDGSDVTADCDDARSDVFPGAAEVWYDGVDQDCDGNDLDQDGDGANVDVDCDDTDPSVTSCDTGDTGAGDTGDTGPGDTGPGDTDTGPGDTDTADTDTPDTADTADTDSGQTIGDPADDTGEDPKAEGCAGCASGNGAAGGLGLAALAVVAAATRRRRF